MSAGNSSNSHEAELSLTAGQALRLYRLLSGRATGVHVRGIDVARDGFDHSLTVRLYSDGRYEGGRQYLQDIVARFS